MKNKKILHSFTLLSLAFLGLGALSSAFCGTRAAHADTKTANVTGVQIRKSTGAADTGYLVVNMSEYASLVADTRVSDPSSYNSLSKISVTLSESGEQVLLSSIASATNWTQNKWGSSGLMFNIPEVNYAVYNGASVYSIIIEKGCELPCGDDVYVTNRTYSFTNDHYGDTDYTDSAFWFTGSSYCHPETEVHQDPTGVQLRGESTVPEERYLVIQSACHGNLNPSDRFQAGDYNTFSKIRLTLGNTDSGVLLSDLDISDRTMLCNKWGSAGLMIHLDGTLFDLYNGASVYTVTIEAGCELPIDDTNVLVTDHTVTFLNDNFQEDSAMFSGFYFTKVNLPTNRVDGNLYNVQLRGVEEEASSCYIVLRSEIFKDCDPSVSFNGDMFNTLSKVTLYLSSNAQGIALADLAIQDHTFLCNRWESWGLMIHLDGTLFDTYNGCSVYKVTVEAGCEIPIDEMDLLVTSETVTFYNASYLDPDAKYSGFDFCSALAPETSFDGDVTGVQVRGESEHAKNRFLVLQSASYVGADTSSLFNGDNYNTFEKITLFLSPEDEGTKLSALGILDHNFIMNRWGCGGLMIHLDGNLYDTYNGSSVYRVLIEEGCELPVSGTDVLVTRSEMSFVNVSYQDESAYYDGFGFTSYPSSIENFGTCQVNDVNFRSANDYETVIFLMKMDFDYESNLLVDLWTRDLNTMDGIVIHTVDGDGNESSVTLREIFRANVTLYLYGEPNAIGFFLNPGDAYTCPYLKSVVIAEGTQIPAVVNGQAGYYTVKEETTFLNNDFGKSGTIPNEYDENDEPRLYEQWCNNWSVQCHVRFTVRGVDLTYPDFIFSEETYLSFDDYYISGYDLSVVTADGDHAYQGLYLSPDDRTVNLILTYTPEEKKESSGCSGNVVSCSLILSGLSVFGLALLNSKKRGLTDEK